MEFTFKEYGKILNILEHEGYKFVGYNNWSEAEKAVILRHDVDVSLKKACEMAEFESIHGVTSTYFILITGDFYNAFNKRNLKYIKRMNDLGMEIGLHFDETIYDADCDMVKEIEKEILVMENMLELKVHSVSMHVPSKKTLDADYVISQGDVINSYSDTFFHKFKYVSDSKMNWRENIYEIIASGKYKRIHLLTHPVWYNEKNMSMWDTVSGILCSQVQEAYEDFEIHTAGVVGRKTVKECMGEIDDLCK